MAGATTQATTPLMQEEVNMHGQPKPKWFKPGARTTLSPFGQRNSGPLLLLILIQWTLGYGPSWRERPALCHIQM